VPQLQALPQLQDLPHWQSSQVQISQAQALLRVSDGAMERCSFCVFMMMMIL
jgi:hypothetical protein